MTATWHFAQGFSFFFVTIFEMFPHLDWSPPLVSLQLTGCNQDRHINTHTVSQMTMQIWPKTMLDGAACRIQTQDCLRHRSGLGHNSSVEQVQGCLPDSDRLKKMRVVSVRELKSLLRWETFRGRNAGCFAPNMMLTVEDKQFNVVFIRADILVSCNLQSFRLFFANFIWGEASVWPLCRKAQLSGVLQWRGFFFLFSSPNLCLHTILCLRFALVTGFLLRYALAAVIPCINRCAPDHTAVKWIHHRSTSIKV